MSFIFCLEDDLLKEDQAFDTLGLTHMNFVSVPFHQSLCCRHHVYRMSFNCQLLLIGNGDQQQVYAMSPAIWSEEVVVILY